MSSGEMFLVGDITGDLEKKGCRAGFGDALLELAEDMPELVVLTGDLADSTRVAPFAAAHPSRFFDMGVAEQNMMGVAAGLAIGGKVPFLTSYATFSPGRNWDQFRVSVAYTEANVKVVGAHAGLSVGPDGATHEALEDIAIVRVLPGVTVVVPCDYEQARLATHALAHHRGPDYIRFGRENTPVFTTPRTPFELGRAQVYRDGSDVTIVGCGPLVHEALLAASQLAEEGISARVVNSHTVKPLDVETIVRCAEETGAIVSVEEHQVTGGLGGAIAEALARNRPTPMEFVGMPDSFGESGKAGELLEKWGLTAPSITRKVRAVLARKASVLTT
ncbi:MAG TPA: transketolase C-terminal domain-containing protein [Candidatus Dormibacteraeota bacterium]|nr:transketolase C-terminal domain-containing protein [Candidatus Dormibacteraeota bacterium]